MKIGSKLDKKLFFLNKNENITNNRLKVIIIQKLKEINHKYRNFSKNPEKIPKNPNFKPKKSQFPGSKTFLRSTRQLQL